jgi:hypothetical protein
MAHEAAADVPNDLEQLRRRFEEFRNTPPVRSRLPEALWIAAAELAQRYGVHPTARTLRPDYTALKRRLETRHPRRAKRKVVAPPNFMEFVAPGAKAVTNCTIEVESAQGGKLRLELKAVATTELVSLIQAFVSHYLHMPLIHAPGHNATRTTYNGYVFTSKDAQTIVIPPLPEGWNGLDRKTVRCKNFQFGVAQFGYPNHH